MSKALFNALIDCICTVGCPAECANTLCVLVPPDGTCQNCLFVAVQAGGKCNAEFNACANDI